MTKCTVTLHPKGLDPFQADCLFWCLCLSFDRRMCFRMEFNMLKAENTAPHTNAECVCVCVCVCVSAGCVLQLHV